MPRRDRTREPETWLSTFHSLLAATAIDSLRVGCTFIPETDRQSWFGIVRDPRRLSLMQFELSRGLDRDRSTYNLACVAKVRSTLQTHVGRRAGWCDLFVPVARHGELKGVLVFGPVLTDRPTRASLERGWRNLTGTRADSNDESFLLYIRSTFDSHVFEGSAFGAFRAFAEGLAATMAGTAHPPKGPPYGTDTWRPLRELVPELWMWELASEIVDRDLNLVWTAPYKLGDLAYEGISRLPNYVVAVAPHEGTHDAVSRLVSTHELQRACAVVAATLPDTIAGRVGSEAAFLLTHLAVGPRAARARLRAFADRITRFVKKKLDIDVACGISRLALHGRELPARYDEALRAGLWGVHKSVPFTFYADLPVDHDATSTSQLYRSTRSLFSAYGAARVKESRVAAEQVTRDVLWISGGNLDVMRSHFLEILWELLAITERRTVVDQRTAQEMLAGFTDRLRKALTIPEIASTFTQLVHGLSEMARRPGDLGRRARLEHARRLVEQGGPNQSLELAVVAKSVGMSIPHFCRSFRETFGTSFAKYAFLRRIEHGKQLLRQTSLRVTEVSDQLGFTSASYFHQAFKRATGSTPARYRTGRGRSSAGPVADP